MIQVDEFVNLGTGQPPAAFEQLLEPVPGGGVGEHERVDIHGCDPSSVGGMVFQPEPLVTGDAVQLEVSIAQLPVRAAAALIDVAVMAAGYGVLTLLWALTLSEFDPALSAAVLIIFMVLVLVGYPVVFETATRGRSLGKMAFGLRVVSDDGGPERLRQAVFRALSSLSLIHI